MSHGPNKQFMTPKKTKEGSFSIQSGVGIIIEKEIYTTRSQIQKEKINAFKKKNYQ